MNLEEENMSWFLEEIKEDRQKDSSSYQILEEEQRKC